MKCPQCKTPVEKEDLFCPNCGCRLEHKKEANRFSIIIPVVLLLIISVSIGIWIFYGKNSGVDSDIKMIHEGSNKTSKNSSTNGQNNTDTQMERQPEYDIDCTSDSASIEGNIVQDGADYYLAFSDGELDLLIEDTDGEESVLEGQTRIQLKTSDSLIPYNGRLVEATGKVSTSEGKLIMQLDDIYEEDDYDPTEGGIHRYEFVISDCTWEEAYKQCISKGGYLARINSQREYDYILNEISKKGMKEIHFNIGGRRDLNSHDYYWVNEKNQLYGEKINSSEYWCINEWMANEPSFEDGEIQENCLDIFYYENEGRWVWNDVPNDIVQVVSYYSGKLGYICEYED